MLPYTPKVVEFLHSRIEVYTDVVLAACERGAKGRYSRDDIRQLTLGWVAMITESLNDEGTQTRDFYMDTAIPGIIANGEDPISIMYPPSVICFVIALDVAKNFKEGNLEEIAEWFTEFFPWLLRDLQKSATNAHEAMRATSIRSEG